MAEGIKPSRVGTEVTTAALNVERVVAVDVVAEGFGPRSVEVTNIVVVRKDRFEAWPDFVASLGRYDREVAFPAGVGLEGHILANIVLRHVFSTTVR